MHSRLIKSLLVFALYIALQLGGVVKVHAETGKQAGAKTSVNQNTRHDQLIAEAGTEVNAPTLQVSVQAAAFFTTANFCPAVTLSTPTIGRASNVPTARFYRLILFPFHGFW